MPIKYKIDIIKALKEKGYNTNRIRKEKIFSEGTMTKFRNGDLVTLATLGTLCQLLDCQPQDIIEYKN